MTDYQKRMNRFVWIGNAYLLGCPVAIWYFQLGGLAWLIYASTGMIHFCLAVASDALYDSLRHKVLEAASFGRREVNDA
ncbi:MAG: hypothetical protein KF892_23820 [Rhizobacter sp.]|nr:hypothetical protein [Rhizobacter sp.]